MAALTTGPVVVSLPAQARTNGRDDPEDDALEEAAGPGWLKNAYVLTAGAGIGLFAFSFVVLAVWPNRVLDEQIVRTQQLREVTKRPIF